MFVVVTYCISLYACSVYSESIKSRLNYHIWNPSNAEDYWGNAQVFKKIKKKKNWRSTSIFSVVDRNLID